MPSFTDSLRGYGHPIYQRDNFTCRYCGADGKASFAVWLTLSVDHLLPVRHPDREKVEYKVTSCMFCNVADNQYFRHAEKRGVRFDGLTPDELVEQRRPYVENVRQAYREFWEANVNASTE